MARSYAPIYTSIWQDPDFIALSPGAQRVYVLAVSQANVAYTGVVSYTAKRWAGLAKGTKPADIRRAVDELVAAGFVILDEQTEELWIRSFIKYNQVLRQPQLKAAMWKAFDDICSAPIRRALLSTLPPKERPPRPLASDPPSPAGSRAPSRPPSPAGSPEGCAAPRGIGSTNNGRVNQNTEPEPSSSSRTPTPPNREPEGTSDPGPPLDDDDEDMAGKAMTIIAGRRMAASTRQIDNRTGWLKATVAGLWAEYDDQLNRVELGQFTTADQLVDWLEPPGPRNGHPAERTVAAARARAADDQARADNPCPKCDGNRRIEATGDFCDACAGRGIRT